jgi:hypothetical protein
MIIKWIDLALSRLKQGFDSPRERQSTIFYDIVRCDCACGVLPQLDNESIAQAAWHFAPCGLPIGKELGEASPVRPMMDWNGSLNLSAS